MTSRRAPLEKSIQRRCVQHAESLGIIVIKQTSLGRYGTSGWPDCLLVLTSGMVLWVEIKRPGESLTRLQQHRQERLRQNRQVVATVHSLDEFRAVLGAHGVPPCPTK